MTLRTAALVAAIGLSVGLAACETATPYQPLQGGSEASGGYADQKLDTDHIQVTFKGNTVTSRRTVEQYLLYRAAELTISQGFDWFETVDRWTDVSGYTTIYGYGYGGGWGWGGFGPSWRYWGGGGWGPWGGWGGGATVTESRQFEATAVVLMHRGPKPAGYSRGLDARDVMNNLRPRIVLPQPKKS